MAPRKLGLAGEKVFPGEAIVGVLSTVSTFHRWFGTLRGLGLHCYDVDWLGLRRDSGTSGPLK